MENIKKIKHNVFGCFLGVGITSLISMFFPIAISLYNDYELGIHNMGVSMLFAFFSVVIFDIGIELIILSILAYLMLFISISTIIFAGIMMGTSWHSRKIAIVFMSLCIVFNITFFIYHISMAVTYYQTAALAKFTLVPLHFIPLIAEIGCIIGYSKLEKKNMTIIKQFESQGNTITMKDKNLREQMQFSRDMAKSKGAEYFIVGERNSVLLVYKNKIVFCKIKPNPSQPDKKIFDNYKTIYYVDIAGIQLKFGSWSIYGYLKVESISDCNKKIRFDIDMNEMMSIVKAYIEKRTAEYNDIKYSQIETKSAVANTTGTKFDATQLIEIKQLLDNGIISQDEFDVMKKKLLGL